MDDVFSPPSSDLNAPPIRRHETAAVSEGIIDALSSTRPWVMLFSILGFLGVALMVLVGGSFLVMGLIGTAATVSEGPLTAMLGGGGAALFGLLYIVLGILYAFPPLYLWRYASAIEDLKSNHSSDSLEQALVQQKSFWKFVGILTLGMFVLYILLMIAAVVIGVGAAAAGA